MQDLEQLIRKFWLNETSEEDNHRLLRLLQENKDQYQDQAEQIFGTDEGEDIDMDKAALLLTKIHLSLGIQEPEERTRVRSIRPLYKYLTVAAAITAIVISLFLLLPHRQTTPATAALKETTPADPRLEQLVSSRDSGRSITMEDGSVIQLKKNSRLSFYRPFKSDRRDLWLEGNAVFEVAKDKKRPFTVYAGEIETRALGTKFCVNADDPRKIKVQLLEGKVAVNAAPGARNSTAIGEVILTPGQQFSFDRNSHQYAVNNIAASPVAQRTTRKSSLPVDNQPELVFHKEPISMVFKKVGDLYKVPLVFHPEELNGLYFTGTFLKSDNLDLVLSAICNVNNLLFTKEKDSIIITKQH